MFHHGEGQEKDVAKAIALYRTACHWYNGNGCTNLGSTLVSRQDAARLYARGCQLEDAAGCCELYKMSRSAPLLEKVKRLDQRYACQN